MPKKINVFENCPRCGGSGLDRFLIERDTAHICNNCFGFGRTHVKYIPFVQRRQIDGIKKVNVNGTIVTYKEFLTAKKPASLFFNRQ